MAKREIIDSFVKMCLVALAMVFALLCGMAVFGWFSNSIKVTANGASIKSVDLEQLEIRATATGEDIGVSVIEKTMKKLPLETEDGDKTLYPGISGSFTFYVYSNMSDTEKYSFVYDLFVDNDCLYEGADYPEGFYFGAKPEERAQALEYINAHLMFFAKNEGGVYSEWIKPGTKIKCSNVDSKTPYKVTVYWVWVGQYNQIFKKDSGLIEENTRTEIAGYYSEEENIGKMLAEGESSSTAYNVADTLIGMTLKYICFQISVLKA